MQPPSDSKLLGEQTYPVHIHVYYGGNVPLALNDTCVAIQGEIPCDGDPLVPCDQKFTGCNSTDKRACTDDIGRLLSTLGDKLPDEVVREESHWLEPTVGVIDYEDDKSYVVNAKTGQRELVPSRQRRARIAARLKGWTLSQREPRLALEIVPMPEYGISVLSPKTIKTIIGMKSNIMDILYFKAVMFRQRGDGDFLSKLLSRPANTSSTSSETKAGNSASDQKEV